MSEKLPVHDITDELPAEIGEIDLYQKREKIYTRKIEGFFQRIRVFTGWPLLLGYFATPWLQWNGKQAILFDLPARKFHIFGLTLWPQDFPLLAWALIISAFSLFLVTKLFGRVWCGYSCPQTVWTSMFMWIEQRTEGTRNQRIKLDKAPWSLQKLIKKVLKHGLWLGLAFYTAFTFVAYFTSANKLIVDFFEFSVNAVALFWIGLFTLLTYLNAGWLREQVCMYMCPYARFQSVMYDSNTLTVSYNAARGEPRGSRKKDVDPKTQNLGDCIDCELCVQVCPTGIDIRNGLQYECIGCALCIDACNSIMDKMHYPRNLISYSTENQLLGKADKKNLFFRLDTLGYALVVAVMIGLFSYTLSSRVPLKLDIIRDRGQLYNMVDNTHVENSYTARIMNMSDSPQTLDLGISGNEHAELLEQKSIEIASGELAEIQFRIRMAIRYANQAVIPLEVNINSLNNNALSASAETRFLSPAGNTSDDK